MRHGRRLLLLAALIPVVTARAEGAAPAISQVERLLAEEQVDEAVAGAQALYRELPDVAPVQVLAGTLKFYQGDYQGAVTLLERGLTAYGATAAQASPMLELARGAREVTASYRSFESEHFVLRTPAGRGELLAPYALQALERAYLELGQVFGHRPARKVVVDVLDSPSQLARMSPLTEQAIATSGTVALAKYGRLMITSPKALFFGYPWLDTLAHEYIHLLITERTRNNVPVWLHEGLAKYYESAWRGAPGQALDPGSERLLAEAVRDRRLITFEQMHPSMALLPTQEATALAFAQVYTVVEFLRGAHGDGVVGQLLGRVRDGMNEEAAIAAVAGQPFGRFVEAWQQHLRQRPYQVIPGAAPRQLVLKKKGQRDDLELDARHLKLDPRVEKLRRLGSILRGAGRSKAAAVEYQRAVDLAGPAAPALYSALAHSYLEAGDVERARATLELALRALPDDPQVWILAGRAALLQKRLADARQAFEQANRVHPFHPEIHASLLAIGRELGDQALVEQEGLALHLLSQPDNDDEVRCFALPRDADAEAGLLTLETVPFARVRVDDCELGLWTPVLELRLKPGLHKLRLQNISLGVDEELEVTLQAGQTTRLSRALRTTR